jgi:hypothetical protein
VSRGRIDTDDFSDRKPVWLTNFRTSTSKHAENSGP